MQPPQVQVVTLTVDQLERMLQRSAQIAVDKVYSHEKKYLNRRDAAAYLGISTASLDRMAIKDGIPYIQPELSTIKLYHVKDLDEWAFANRH